MVAFFEAVLKVSIKTMQCYIHISSLKKFIELLKFYIHKKIKILATH